MAMLSTDSELDCTESQTDGRDALHCSDINTHSGSGVQTRAPFERWLADFESIYVLQITSLAASLRRSQTSGRNHVYIVIVTHKLVVKCYISEEETVGSADL